VPLLCVSEARLASDALTQKGARVCDVEAAISLSLGSWFVFVLQGWLYIHLGGSRVWLTLFPCQHLHQRSCPHEVKFEPCLLVLLVSDFRVLCFFLKKTLKPLAIEDEPIYAPPRCPQHNTPAGPDTHESACHTRGAIMTFSTFNARIFTSIFALAFIASTCVACDGGEAENHSTSTHALEAQLGAANPAMSYDLRVRVFAPKNEAAERFERVSAPRGTTEVIEAGLDLSSSAPVGISHDALKESFAASVEAIANNEYIGEREAQDAVNQPFFTTFPIAACGGNFPCDLVVRIDVEAFDMSPEESVEVHGAVWVASGYYDVQIIDVSTFPTY